MTEAATPGRDEALDLLRQMIRIRRFEERAAELYTEMKIRGFLHLYDGEEAVACGVMPNLRAGDAVVATYREHGHAIARGIPMDRVMAEGSLYALGFAEGLQLANRLLGKTGGVLAATLLTLFLVPVLYLLIASRTRPRSALADDLARQRQGNEAEAS